MNLCVMIKRGSEEGQTARHSGAQVRRRAFMLAMIALQTKMIEPSNLNIANHRWASICMGDHAHAAR